MLSRTTDSSVSGAEPLEKLIVLKWFSCHFCPPFGSADFFSEIANPRVRMGPKLESLRGISYPG